MRKDYDDDDKIQRNLEKYLDDQIEEYGYINNIDFDEDKFNKNDGYDRDNEYADDDEYEDEYDDEDEYESPKHRSNGGSRNTVNKNNRRANQGRNTNNINKSDRNGKKEKPQGLFDKVNFVNRDKSKKSKSGMKKRKRRKSSKFKKLLLGIIIFILIILGLWYFLVGNAYDKMNYEEIPSLKGTAMNSEGVTNILLIGNDSRKAGEDGRSDAMILVSISNKTKKIYMTSLLRDMYVQIPGHGGNRLNAAYSFGGAELLMTTLEQNLGIKIDRYILVNFQAFANLVDAVGGVDIDVTNDEVQWINAYLDEYNMLQGRDLETDYLDTSLSGVIHLNGPQSLAYSRNRYIGTDFERTARQRKVLSAVMKKLPLSVVTNYNGIINGLCPNLTTNLTKTETYLLSLNILKLPFYSIEQITIPQDGTYTNKKVNGMDVLSVDFDANKTYIQQTIYGK